MRKQERSRDGGEYVGDVEGNMKMEMEHQSGSRKESGKEKEAISRERAKEERE